MLARSRESDELRTPGVCLDSRPRTLVAIGFAIVHCHDQPTPESPRPPFYAAPSMPTPRARRRTSARRRDAIRRLQP